MFQVVVNDAVVFTGTFCQCEKEAEKCGGTVRLCRPVAYRATMEEVLAARLEAALVAEGVTELAAGYAARDAAYDAVLFGESEEWAADMVGVTLDDDEWL